MGLTLNKVDFDGIVDLDIRDLTHASDSVKVGDGTNFLAVDGSGNIGVTDAGGSITVDAVDFDIRDVTHVSDSIKIGDGTDFLAVNADGSINTTISAVDLDIRDLVAATDSVAAWMNDGSGNAITSSGGALDVNIQSSDISIDVEEEANTAIENTAYSASTTGADILGASQLAARKYMLVQNLGAQSIFVGKPGVTASNGLRLFKNNTLEVRLGPALALHAVTSSGTADVRVMELS